MGIDAVELLCRLVWPRIPAHYHELLDAIASACTYLLDFQTQENLRLLDKFTNLCKLLQVCATNPSAKEHFKVTNNYT